MRIVEAVADAGHTDTLKGMAEQHGAVDTWCGVVDEDGRQAARILVPPESRQALLDAIQSVLGASGDYRLLVLPVDAALPRLAEQEEQERAWAVSTTRE